MDLEKHLDEYIKGHQREHDLDRDNRQRELQTAELHIERRLEKLNELRDEVTKDRQQFLKVDTYDAKHDQLIADLHRLDRDLVAVREDISTQKGRSAAFAVVLTVVLVVISIVLPILLD